MKIGPDPMLQKAARVVNSINSLDQVGAALRYLELVRKRVCDQDSALTCLSALENKVHDNFIKET